MPATIRLMRLGKKGRPFYRIIVIDKRKKRNGKYIQVLGDYNPLTNPATINLDQEKFDDWIAKGAVVSEGLRKLRIGKKSKGV